MTVETATPEELAQLNAFVQHERAVCIQFFTVMNNINALVLGWNSNIEGIIGIPDGTLIHDGSGLAGSSELTDQQVTDIFTTLQQMSVEYNTDTIRNLFVLATGAGNTLGS